MNHGLSREEVEATYRLKIREQSKKIEELTLKMFDYDRNEDEIKAGLCKRITELEAACKAALRLIDEALPKFNWGASCLDGNAIQLLNETPGIIQRALENK